MLWKDNRKLHHLREVILNHTSIGHPITIMIVYYHNNEHSVIVLGSAI